MFPFESFPLQPRLLPGSQAAQLGLTFPPEHPRQSPARKQVATDPGPGHLFFPKDPVMAAGSELGLSQCFILWGCRCPQGIGGQWGSEGVGNLPEVTQPVRAGG